MSEYVGPPFKSHAFECSLVPMFTSRLTLSEIAQFCQEVMF